MLSLVEAFIGFFSRISKSDGRNPMSKRIFCFALGALLLALYVSADAQQPKKVPRIGLLGLASCLARPEEAFLQGSLELAAPLASF